ncbi:MAG: hypothetical protein KC731_42760, partial [Myxococcales bacterium]|nr:hypothetical protein [Myxococcales bacterium]
VLKAAVLASEVGRVRAASTAVLLSALPLLAHAVVSVPCVIAAYAVWGPTGLTGAIALQLGTAVALGGFLLVASRTRQVGRLAERLSVELGAETERVQADLRAMGRLGWRAFGLQLVGRALLLLEIVLLAAAAGVPRGLVGGLLTAGVHFVGQAVGDVVPAQLGVVDGAWALAASALNASAAALAAAAITFHAVRLAWAALGSVAFVGMRR